MKANAYSLRHRASRTCPQIFPGLVVECLKSFARHLEGNPAQKNSSREKFGIEVDCTFFILHQSKIPHKLLLYHTENLHCIANFNETKLGQNLKIMVSAICKILEEN